MKLSVIIPCLNGEATLAVQLEALAAQKWSEPWELIISDNGSTDNSMKIARRYKKHFPAFRIVDAFGKKRQSHALNVGVRAASADRVAFCDADDEVAPGWVAAIGDALNENDIVHGQFHFDKFNEPRHAKKAAQDWKNGLIQRLFLPGGGAGNLGIMRWVHEAIGGFDECLPRFADADYYWRLQLEGFELHYVPEAVVQVRIARVNPSLPYLYHRGRTAAATRNWSYKRYRSLGMLPPPLFKESLVAWLKLIRGIAKDAIQGKQKSVAWQKQIAQRTGDLVGQLQGRLTNPCKPYHPHKRALAKNQQQ